MARSRPSDPGRAGAVAVMSFAALLATLIFMFQASVLQQRTDRFVRTTGTYFLVSKNGDQNGQGRQLVLYRWSVAGEVYANQKPMGRGWAPEQGPFEGDTVPVWYDPMNPQDHHTYKMPKYRDADRLIWVSAALGAICMVASWLTWRRWAARPYLS